MRYMGRLIPVFILLALAPLRSAADTEIREFTGSMEEVIVCASDTPDCRRQSCLDVCLAESDEPLDCPAYCILHAVSAREFPFVALTTE